MTVRQSSSPSDGLLGGLSGARDVDRELSDSSLLRAMLDAEAALARAAADAGVLPPAGGRRDRRTLRAERY
ncbi:3-carboxy-cis,cis-muconate cycloisomerase, partial [Micromonospora sp. STR1s_6]|nr:3-carboxy-cis,cis-muconate cycloisomerase [Micromonospora tarensis]